MAAPLSSKKKKKRANPCHLTFLCFRACPELLRTPWQLGANLSLEDFAASLQRQTWCFCGVFLTHNFLFIVPLAFSEIQAEKVPPVRFCYFKPRCSPALLVSKSGILSHSFPVCGFSLESVGRVPGPAHPIHPARCSPQAWQTPEPLQLSFCALKTQRPRALGMAGARGKTFTSHWFHFPAFVTGCLQNVTDTKSPHKKSGFYSEIKAEQSFSVLFCER